MLSWRKVPVKLGTTLAIATPVIPCAGTPLCSISCDNRMPYSSGIRSWTVATRQVARSRSPS